MVGELTLQFLQSSKVAVFLIQDPPQSWLAESQLGRFKVFTPCETESLTAILVDQKFHSSSISLGAARVCVV